VVEGGVDADGFGGGEVGGEGGHAVAFGVGVHGSVAAGAAVAAFGGGGVGVDDGAAQGGAELSVGLGGGFGEDRGLDGGGVGGVEVGAGVGEDPGLGQGEGAGGEGGEGGGVVLAELLGLGDAPAGGVLGQVQHQSDLGGGGAGGVGGVAVGCGVVLGGAEVGGDLGELAGLGPGDDSFPGADAFELFEGFGGGEGAGWGVFGLGGGVVEELGEQGVGEVARPGHAGVVEGWASRTEGSNTCSILSDRAALDQRWSEGVCFCERANGVPADSADRDPGVGCTSVAAGRRGIGYHADAVAEDARAERKGKRDQGGASA
jgi:hypothetical protein